MNVTNDDVDRLIHFPTSVLRKMHTIEFKIKNESNHQIKQSLIDDYKTLHTILILGSVKSKVKQSMAKNYQPMFYGKENSKTRDWLHGNYLNDLKVAIKRYQHAKKLQRQYQKFQQQKQYHETYNHNDPLGVDSFLDKVYALSKKDD